MPVAELAQGAEPPGGREHVAALAEDRLDDDRGDLRRRDEPLEQDLEVLHVAEHACGSTPGSSGPNPVRYFALLAVSDTLPRDRPWNEPIIAMMFCRPVA